LPELTARDLALKILKAVEEDGAYANLALNQVLEKHRPGKLDRAFTTELVYGTLRYLNTLDWVLSQFTRQPLSAQTVTVRNILRLGVYQLMFMDRVPQSAACNEGAKMARKYGHGGAVKFVNGVLRNVSRRRGEIEFPGLEKDPVLHISLFYSHPAWMVERWIKEFGLEETILLCRADNEPAPNTVRTNTLKSTRTGLADELSKNGLEKITATRYAPEGLQVEGFLSMGSLKAFKQGLFQVQDESSMLASRALMPEPGSFVIDACSAPGGKTTHLAQLMKNQGRLLAVDIHPHKIPLIEENCSRLGITAVETVVADARELPAEYEQKADFILLDAPCSGLGILRRRPDARWRKDPSGIKELVKLQSEIMAGVSRCLKRGGVLVYSTCTITHEENLGQVEKFLSRHPEFELEDLTPVLPAGLDFEGTLKRGWLRILSYRNGMDGFFIARMRKKGAG
jgi:16S rRNA (cytosine967-C5)-methyltransferase